MRSYLNVPLNKTVSINLKKGHKDDTYNICLNDTMKI